MTSAILGQTGFQISLNPFFLFVIFTLAMLVWGVFFWVIRYHLKKYGTSILETLAMTLVFLLGSGVLLAGLALFAFLYNLSAQ